MDGSFWYLYVKHVLLFGFLELPYTFVTTILCTTSDLNVVCLPESVCLNFSKFLIVLYVTRFLHG